MQIIVIYRYISLIYENIMVLRFIESFYFSEQGGIRFDIYMNVFCIWIDDAGDDGV